MCFLLSKLNMNKTDIKIQKLLDDFVDEFYDIADIIGEKRFKAIDNFLSQALHAVAGAEKEETKVETLSSDEDWESPLEYDTEVTHNSLDMVNYIYEKKH